MIILKNINKKYKDIYSLKDINLHIKKGECIILKGVSGSGKSTLLSIISGINKPTSGEIRVKDEYISKLPDKFASEFRNQHLGFVFQSFNLIDNFSVRENINSVLTVTNDCKESIETKLKYIMKKCKIEHKENELAKVLSGGEKQRCAIARAMVNNPEILLADEPTANLDKENSLVFLEFVKEFYSSGKTVVVATHDDIFDTLDIPKRVIYMENGEIL
jgi:putative ABC transport system ATP-binding protein